MEVSLIEISEESEILVWDEKLSNYRLALRKELFLISICVQGK